MADVTITITKNRFPEIARRFGPAVDEITTLALFKVHEAADPNTPRDTGDLANNVQVTPSQGGQGGQVHWLMEYSGFVDKGTVHMAPRLFATNAATLIQPQWVAALRQLEGRL